MTESKRPPAFDRVLFSIWVSYIWNPISIIFESIITLIVLPLVRWYIDNIGVWYRRLWYERLPRQIGPGVCVDGYHPTHGVQLTFGVPYGNREWETVDIVEKVDEDSTNEAPVVIYLHGGGFVAANSEVLLHSLCIPLARAGCRPFSINYPLGPTQQFPSQIISTIRAMAWVKKRTGVEKVILIGDSAGGAIVTTTAALLSSKTVDELEQQLGVDMSHWDLPKIESVISIYGVLDRVGWNDQKNPITGKYPDLKWHDHIGALVLRFCLRCYGAEGPLSSRCLLSDFSNDELSKFPKTLVLCGKSDPLIHGNRKEVKRMQGLGRDVIMKEYSAHHAFVGFPIAWNFSWRKTTWPAYLEILKFVQGVDKIDTTIFPNDWPRDVPIDIVLPCAVLLCLALVPVVVCITFFRFVTSYLRKDVETSTQVLKHRKGKLIRTKSEMFRATAVRKISRPID